MRLLTAYVSVGSQDILRLASGGMSTVYPILFMFVLNRNKCVPVLVLTRGSCALHSNNVLKLAGVGSMGHALTILGILYF